MNGVVEAKKPKLVRLFRDLAVYNRAYEISLDIHKRSLEFPKLEQYSLGDQMRRASRSICANIAEGFAKQSASPSEFRRFLTMAIGSSTEMQVWIQYSYDLHYIDEETAARWQDGFDHIARMLNRLHGQL